MKHQKVFGIGFHRSGTTSLQTALEELGYSVIGMREAEWNAYATGDYETIGQSVRTFDAFRDMPWPLLYKWLYANIPDARFILTYRDPEAWAKSCRDTYKNRPHPMFPVIYGVETFAGSEAVCQRVYLEHIENVRAFFKNKDDIFLEIDLTREPGWGPLCGFLGEPVPQRTFPHANRRPQTLLDKGLLKAIRLFSPARYRRRMRDK